MDLVSLRAALLTAALGVGVVFAADAPQAFAQHVVTDNEAGKLTLDALTAAPRPVYRTVMATRRAHRPGYVSRSMHASSKAAFHRRVTSRARVR